MSEDKIVGLGEQSDPESVPLATRERRWIRNRRRRPRAPESMKAAADKWLLAHPEARLRSLDSTYNCFGMVFASRRTCIISGAEVEKVLADDGYREEVLANVEVGDLVVYRSQESPEIHHVGVIMTKRFAADPNTSPLVVMSQWGADGEYLHPENAVPAVFGARRTYYTDRRR